jgi:Uma2 family endonuclease
MNILLDREYTPEDLLKLSDGPRYELIEGRLVERAMGASSSRIGLRVGGLLDAHAFARNLGDVFGSDCGYQIFPDDPKRVRFPDASFIARGRLPNNAVPEGHVRIRPDLVVEVVSPNDTAEEVDQKVDEYLQVGVRLVWVVYPSTRSVMVFRADGSVARLRSGDELSGEAVVTDFRCPVARLFALASEAGPGGNPAGGSAP